MKLSDKTLTILKNFAGINNSILVKEGTNLRTISVAKNILAEAEIKEEFPREFGIYDLKSIFKWIEFASRILILILLKILILILRKEREE